MAAIRLDEEAGRIVASGNLTLWLTKEVKEAIDASLPVTVRYRVELFIERRFRDHVVGSTVVTKTMRYDRVKESFLLMTPGAGGGEERIETTNAAEAERWFSTIDHVPVAPVASLAPDRRHQARLRAEIELSRRSFPLNLLLFFVPDRNVRTAWAVSPPILVPGGRRP
jgi:hypothetical protein